MKTDSATNVEMESHDSTGRLEAFSDGIFGVAITLLALEIGVQEYEGATDASLLHNILALWPKYVAYINSFATVLLMWLGHHQLFKLVRKPSTSLILANGLSLLFVALVPFPTKTVGQFIQTGAANVAVEFYTGYFLLVSFSFLAVWKVASSKTNSLLQPFVTDQIVASVNRGHWVGILVNLTCFGLSFISPWLGIAANVLSWVYWAVAFND